MENEFFQALDRKVDKLIDTTQEVKIEQVQIKVDLKEHIRRTTIAEARLDSFEKDIRPILEGLKFTKWILTGISFLFGLFMTYLHYHG